MTAKPTRMLAVAAKTGQICCVLLVNGKLRDWRRSRKGSKSAKEAAIILHQWFEEYKPDIFVSENPDTAMRKGERQRRILKVFADIGEDQPCLNIVVPRKSRYKNHYEEAQAIGKRYPEIADLVPAMPPIWLPEPRAMIYFEALSLVGYVVDKDDG